MFYYKCLKDDEDIITKLLELAEKYPTRGFGKIRMEGLIWNRKRVLRVYRSLNLRMRRKKKRRLPSRTKNKLEVPTKLNEISLANRLQCKSPSQSAQGLKPLVV